MSDFKLYFQNIHYNVIKPNFVLKLGLVTLELFYKIAINFKNFLYDKSILKEKKVDIYTICVGNLTTGGVGKTPIVQHLANLYSDKKVAIISRGYSSKLNNKVPNVIKDENKIYYDDGTIVGDEILQLCQNTPKNTVVITCQNRLLALELAKNKYNCKIAIMDDGFSNRKFKKDKSYIVINSKIRFGNEHLLPFGPLREPISSIKRADEIIITNKDDKNINSAINWANKFEKPIKIATITPKRIYNIKNKNETVVSKKAIAFCSIGQFEQFFDFAQKFYEIADKIPFEDHHIYTNEDIEELIKKAKQKNVNTFITTQKDETKLYKLIQNIEGFEFNVLELSVTIS